MSPCVDGWRAVKSTLSDLLGNPSRCNLLSLFLLDSDSNPMKEILPLCAGGSLTSLSLSLFCWKLPSWFFSLKESSFWIFVLLGQIQRDDSHFLSSLFSFFPIPSFLFFLSGFFFFSLNIDDDFSAFCYGPSNASEAVMACLLGWCYKIFRILQHVINLILWKIIIYWVYNTENAHSLVYF